jgi:hypothetical protein
VCVRQSGGDRRAAVHRKPGQRTDHRVDHCSPGAGDGKLIFENSYRVPGLHALEFNSDLESGSTFRIDVEQPRIPAREELEVSTQTCAGGGPADRTDVSVILDSSGPSIADWPCDRAYTYRERLAYVEPAEYTT